MAEIDAIIAENKNKIIKVFELSFF